MSERRFTFRLATVLELRRRRDKEAQDALHAAHRTVVRDERALADAQAALESACGPSAPEIGTIEWHLNWRIGLRAAIARCAGELARSRQLHTKALGQAMAARRALRMIERLRDKRLKAFEAERRRREQQQIDELSNRWHVVNTSGGDQ